MDSNPYQAPATATQPLPDPDAPRRSTAGTVLRILCAVPLLLYSLLTLVGNGVFAYLWAAGRLQWPVYVLAIHFLTGLVAASSTAAWAIGLVLRHRRLTWFGFLAFVICILLTFVIAFAMGDILIVDF